MNGAIRNVVAMQRAVGCIVGSAVGDALGAPFEFGPARQYSRRFPQPVLGGRGEMVGGGSFGWAPGEFTDDTQMAVIVGESLLACGGIDADDQLARFRAWGLDAADVGNLTREVLGSGLPAAESAEAVLKARRSRNTAGNGSIMRAAPGAVHFAPAGRSETMEAGQRLSAVTHADQLCTWGVAIQHELVRTLIAGGALDDAIDSALEHLPPDVQHTYAPLLTSSWSPDADRISNGSVMGALAQAVWAMRRHEGFAAVVTGVIDLGGDTDSVAAVAGALAGARGGIQTIPARWSTYVHGSVMQLDGSVRRYDHVDLQRLALSLFGWPHPSDAPDETPVQPAQVADGVWATNRSGCVDVDASWAVVSLCRLERDLPQRDVTREFWIIDKPGDSNPALPHVVDEIVDTIDAFRQEGRQVVVHCHGGRSRTGLVLAAYLMRHGRTFAEARRELAERWPHAHFFNPSFEAELMRRDAEA